MHRAKAPTESKLTTIRTQLSDMESGLDLSSTGVRTRAIAADPPVTLAELDLLCQRVENSDSSSH